MFKGISHLRNFNGKIKSSNNSQKGKEGEKKLLYKLNYLHLHIVCLYSAYTQSRCTVLWQMAIENNNKQDAETEAILII